MMDSRPKLLDAFCGAGGAARGYMDAGFHVTGVDIEAQPRYCGDRFIRADAMVLLRHRTWLRQFDAIHTSPPCQAHTSLKAMWNRREHPDLVGPTRDRLDGLGIPYVIENVPGAPLLNPVVLCGSMFTLGCERAELRRHRLFETNFILSAPESGCRHGWSGEDCIVGIYGHAGGSSRRDHAVIGVYGGHGRDRKRRTNGQHFSTDARRQAMGIDWMTGTELSQAIPPAYTRWIGAQLMRAVGTGKFPCPDPLTAPAPVLR